MVLGSGGPPETIPTPPSIELTHDEITDGELIGQGGIAEVYRVDIERDGRTVPVAVKQPHIQGTVHSETVDRFAKEAKVWNQLDDHEHVISVFDWGVEPIPWLAMEYAAQGTLADVLDGGPLPLDEAAWIGLCICRALRHAHRHGVAHHDIKPANVLLTAADGWPVPKVSDWGLARLMLEETGTVDGFSPQYAAPEQFDSTRYGSPDDQTDIYQVGTVLYELVVGRPPFEGSATDVMQSVLSEDPAPPSTVSGVPEEIDDVVLPALRKEPSDRYDSIIYLRDKLEKLFEILRDGSATTAATAGRARSGTGRSEQPSATDSQSTNDGSGEDTLLSRRQTLLLMSTGVVGVTVGTFLRATDGGGGGSDGGGSDDTIVADDGETQVSQRLQVVGETGRVADNSVDLVTLLVKLSPGANPIDLSELSIQYVGPDGTDTLVHASSADDESPYYLDVVTAESEADLRLTDPSDRYRLHIPFGSAVQEFAATGSAESDLTPLGGNSTANNTGTAVTRSAESDLTPLGEGEEADLLITTASSATTSVVVVVPDTLSGYETGETVTL